MSSCTTLAEYVFFFPEYVFFPPLVAQLWQTSAGTYARVYMYVFIGFTVVVCFDVRCIEMRVACKCDVSAQLMQ